MQVTQHTDYALRVLIYVACNEGKLVNISRIAQTYDISKNHLMKVVPSLVKGGFLIGVRGNRGGLKLALPPSEINIGEVFKHTESLQLIECFGEKNECHITPSCRLAKIFNGAQNAFLHYLDGFTLEDLINDDVRKALAEDVED